MFSRSSAVLSSGLTYGFAPYIYFPKINRVGEIDLLCLGSSAVLFTILIASIFCSFIMGSVGINDTLNFLSVDTNDVFFTLAAFKGDPCASSKLTNFSIWSSIELYINDSRCSSAF